MKASRLPITTGTKLLPYSSAHTYHNEGTELLGLGGGACTSDSPPLSLTASSNSRDQYYGLPTHGVIHTYGVLECLFDDEVAVASMN